MRNPQVAYKYSKEPKKLKDYLNPANVYLYKKDPIKKHCQQIETNKVIPI